LTIYTEDCKKTFGRDLLYDYVLCSPPDYDELNLNTKKDSYDSFLYTWMPMLKPKGNFVTICISDRKADSRIYSKHISCINVMEKCGWSLKAHKIWVKSLKMDTFRMSYMNLLTFQKRPHKAQLTKEFKADVFIDESSYNMKGYSYGMSELICSYHIKEFSQEGSIVYDPFMGSGTTAVAALNNKRKYLGSEILQKYTDIANKRIDLLEKGIDKSNIV
tara:strand:- start:3101 stop:3754 length:654 start_codon:yes stop_codon:yes gene_type:complete